MPIHFSLQIYFFRDKKQMHEFKYEIHASRKISDTDYVNANSFFTENIFL